MRQVEDAICRGTVGRLMWDGGHCRGGRRRGRRQSGLLPLIRLCQYGQDGILGIQNSYTRQTKEKENSQTEKHNCESELTDQKMKFTHLRRLVGLEERDCMTLEA